MHELALVEGLFKAIEQQKEKHGFKEVVGVQVTCGRRNAHIEEHLEFCFKEMAKSPLLAGAKLTVKHSDTIADDGIYLNRLAVM